KNTVQEFFLTASLTYSPPRRNTLMEQCLSEGTVSYTRRLQPNHSQNWNFKSNFSKGFYDWHLKTSLNLTLSRSTGKQLTNSLLQTYRHDHLQAEPKLIWSPVAGFEAEYHATLGYGGSKIGNDTRLTPLSDIVQRLHLTFGIGRLDLRLSGEHYRNELDAHTHLTTLLADASLVYKTKKWRLEARLNNLFNKKEYAYTLYSATQSCTSRLSLRPREGLVTVSRQL
ncbi:MAG: TonB-dependent receptor, partial [Bacteroides sp.]|nr:TonB-dependent receptor [Bacteroides sp.]